MGLFVKICGLTVPEDTAAVAALKPDAVGFVFWPKSKRYVSLERAAECAARVPPPMLKVGVFVDPSMEDVSAAIDAAGLDVVQLHGDESEDLAAAIPVAVWRVVHLGRTDVPLRSGYRVDAFLADSYSAASPGGTGQVCDWDRVRSFVETSDTPVILAGGLRPETVATAVRRVRPWGVDVSSGVESAPGRKDPRRVKEFIEQCRNC